MSVEYYFYYFYYTFLGYPFIIKVAAIAITFFTPFFIWMIVRFLKARHEYKRKVKLDEVIRDKYMDKIKAIIISEKKYYKEDISIEFAGVSKRLSNKKKNILTNHIIQLRHNLEKINQANYESVIAFFNLSQYWESKLKFGSIASRQTALRKLDDFNIEIPGAVISSLTNNRNRFLRKRARSYYMNLSKNSPYKFFDENFDRTFNDWDKIEIHRILRGKSPKDLPNLVQWIKNSNNSEFKIFLVDEIKYLKQKESCHYLLEILDTVDIRLKKHCIDTLGELRCHLSEKKLIEIYPQEPVIIQRSIVEAIGKLHSGEALLFLEEAYLDAHDDENKLIILNTIYKYGEGGKRLFEAIQNNSVGSKLMFEHVSNSLLNYQRSVINN